MLIHRGSSWVLAVSMALLAGAPSFGQSSIRPGQGPAVLLLDERGLHDLITQRNGKALVLNVWATWCLPCVEEFPALVRLDSAFRRRNVDVVTVSIDFEDEIDGKVRPFLRRMKATMPAYVNAYPTPSDLINAIHQEWSGAIPATFFYDARGSMVAHVVGERSFEQFRVLTEQTLSGSARR